MTQSLTRLTGQDLATLASSLRSGRTRPPFTEVSMRRCVHVDLAAAVADDLQRLVSSGFDAGQVATLVDAVRHDRGSRLRVDELVDVVTTGPEASMASNRDTSVVVRELFGAATRSVVIVGFAVYQGRMVFRALAERMEQIPELKVQLYLDISRKRSDTTVSSLLVRQFLERFKKEQWPENVRLPSLYHDPRSLELSGPTRSSLHAKCVVVDSEQVFVSSANLTEAAQQRNIEVGLLVRSAAIATQIEEHFAKLREANLLQPVGH